MTQASKTTGTGKITQPLQIISVDLDSNEVVVDRKALETIQGNLKAAKVEKISVVSVMGAYRTGKSFILDLFLRYLEHEQNNAMGSSISNFEQGLDGAAAEYSAMMTNSDERSKGTSYDVPKWLSASGAMTEAESARCSPAKVSSDKSSGGGFGWRGGAARCTEGMWMWPKPFIKTITVTEKVSSSEDEEMFVKKKVKVGLLLMDTQGAFDSQTTKQQSATIFGLTTALSSKQLYNIQGRIGSDTIEHLHYFAEMAVAATRNPQTSGKKKEAPFQYLQLLVRDWNYFDDDTWEQDDLCKEYGVKKFDPNANQRWPIGLCKKQMSHHFNQHFGEDVKERNSVDTIKELFSEVSCYLFPAPGLKVSESKKRRWDGTLGDIDEDFVRFLDLYCKEEVFRDVRVNKVLGGDLSPDSFVQVVETLVEAFKGMEVSQMSMVDAISKAKNLVAKDESEKIYKTAMDKAMSVYNAKAGKKPELLEKDNDGGYRKALEHFDASANFGDEGEIAAARNQLLAALAEHWEFYKKENDRRLEKALHAFAGLACFGILAFVVDKLSDVTCDWWSDTCVQMSKMLVLIYTFIIAVILYQVYTLYNTRGHAASSLACVELVKQMVVLAADSSTKVVWYAQNIDDFKKDAKGYCEVLQVKVIQPLSAGFADLINPGDVGTAAPKRGKSPGGGGVEGEKKKRAKGNAMEGVEMTEAAGGMKKRVGNNEAE